MDLTALPTLADRTIWMLHDGGRAAVVDPDDAALVERALQRHGLELAGILVTHPLRDQISGVDAPRQRVSRAGDACGAHAHMPACAAFAHTAQPHVAAIADHIASCERLCAGGGPTLPPHAARQRRFAPLQRRAEAAVVDRAIARRRSAVDVIAASRQWKNEYR